MITTLTDTLKGILGLNKQISKKEIECAIDEQTGKLCSDGRRTCI